LKTEYNPHPAANLFPMMGTFELAELAEDIKKHGLLEPIVIYEEQIIDGRNRAAACKISRTAPKYSFLKECASPTLYAISKNLHRRHLTVSQRAAIAAEMVPMLREEAKARQRVHGGTAPGKPKTLIPKSEEVFLPNAIKGTSNEIAAKAVGVSPSTVGRARQVHQQSPEEFNKVKGGEVTVEQALRNISGKEQPSKRQEILENAHKRRMIDGLSQVKGLCRGLETLNMAAILNSCPEKERRVWALTARECSRQLRIFAREVMNEKDTEIETGQDGGALVADSPVGPTPTCSV